MRATLRCVVALAVTVLGAGASWLRLGSEEPRHLPTPCWNEFISYNTTAVVGVEVVKWRLDAGDDDGHIRGKVALLTGQDALAWSDEHDFCVRAETAGAAALLRSFNIPSSMNGISWHWHDGDKTASCGLNVLATDDTSIGDRAMDALDSPTAALGRLRIDSAIDDNAWLDMWGSPGFRGLFWGGVPAMNGITALVALRGGVRQVTGDHHKNALSAWMLVGLVVECVASLIRLVYHCGGPYFSSSFFTFTQHHYLMTSTMPLECLTTLVAVRLFFELLRFSATSQRRADLFGRCIAPTVAVIAVLDIVKSYMLSQKIGHVALVILCVGTIYVFLLLAAALLFACKGRQLLSSLVHVANSGDMLESPDRPPSGSVRQVARAAKGKGRNAHAVRKTIRWLMLSGGGGVVLLFGMGLIVAAGLTPAGLAIGFGTAQVGTCIMSLGHSLAFTPARPRR